LRVLSGIQPSGRLHIGNYFGAMRQHLQLQAQHESFYFIADYHALTSNPSPQAIAQHTIDVTLDYLALGLDTEKTVFWRQSDMPEVIELAWLLSCVTPMGLLQKCVSYKDKIAQGLSANHGLFAYPVLQAADILIFQSNLVPVGADQKQHIEVTRDIALRFNNAYGEVFTLPQDYIIESVAVVPGVDGRKMSKSYGNTIEIFESEKKHEEQDHADRDRFDAGRVAQRPRKVQRLRPPQVSGFARGTGPVGTALSQRRHGVWASQETSGGTDDRLFQALPTETGRT